MNYTKVIDLLNTGKPVIVMATENVYDFLEDSMDPGMISKIISVEIDDEELIEVKFDLNGFESHNKSVAKIDWHDENGNATKTWFDTSFYPKNGIETAWFVRDQPLPFELVVENKAFEDYLKTDMSKTYVQFLEEKYEELSK